MNYMVHLWAIPVPKLLGELMVPKLQVVGISSFKQSPVILVLWERTDRVVEHNLED